MMAERWRNGMWVALTVLWFPLFSFFFPRTHTNEVSLSAPALTEGEVVRDSHSGTQRSRVNPG